MPITTPSDSEIPRKNEIKKLPHGWTDDPQKLKEQLEGKNKWAEGTKTILPPFLREDKIDANIRRNGNNDKLKFELPP